MHLPNKIVAVGLFAVWLCLPAGAAQQGDPVPIQSIPTEAKKSQAEGHAAESVVIVEEMLAKSSNEPGYLDPRQVKEAVDQIRFAEYRIQDLLTDLKPERWKMSEEARNSFGQTIAALKTQLDALKAWRTQFSERPASIYAGYETYATIGTILPRLEGVAQTVTQADSAGFGAQFSQASGRLFDMQQAIGPYIGFLLQSHDSIQQALESNLASCQDDLGRAMRGQSERPQRMKNSPAIRPKPRR